jgi:hypothetical protein
MAPEGRSRSAAWLAVAAVMRVTPSLLVPVLLLPTPPSIDRRHGRAAGIATVALVGMALLLLLLLVTPYTLEYFTRVLPAIGGGTSNLDNQSLPGVLSRALELWFNAGDLPSAVTLLVTVAFLVPTFALAARALSRRPERSTRGVAFAAFCAAMPIVSAITWQHHLVSELLVYALLAPVLLAARNGRWMLGLTLASYPLMWVNRHLTDAISINTGLAAPCEWGYCAPHGLLVLPYLVVTGLNLIGMICLWSACLLALRRTVAGQGA